MEVIISDPVNDHTHVSVDIFVCLGGRVLQICCDALGELLEENVYLIYGSPLVDTKNEAKNFYCDNQVRYYVFLFYLSCLSIKLLSKQEMYNFASLSVPLTSIMVLVCSCHQ